MEAASPAARLSLGTRGLFPVGLPGASGPGYRLPGASPCTFAGIGLKSSPVAVMKIIKEDGCMNRRGLRSVLVRRSFLARLGLEAVGAFVLLPRRGSGGSPAWHPSHACGLSGIEGPSLLSVSPSIEVQVGAHFASNYFTANQEAYGLSKRRRR